MSYYFNGKSVAYLNLIDIDLIVSNISKKALELVMYVPLKKEKASVLS